MSRKIISFITIAYIISWSSALLIYILGIKLNTVTGIAMVALFFMIAPAISTIIVQKFFHKEALSQYGLTKRGISFKNLTLPFLLLWSIFALYLCLTFILGNILSLAQFGQVNFSNKSFINEINNLTQQNTPELPFPAFIIFIILIIQGSIAGAIFNLPFALGEELGWRGLLQKETQKWGFWKSNSFIGIVWGFWHAPIIAMGHNYPGYSVIGIFMMVLFTIAASFPLCYLRFKTGNIWIPSIFHGVLNAIGASIVLFVSNENPLYGSVAGITGIISLLSVTALILWKDKPFISTYHSHR